MPRGAAASRVHRGQACIRPERRPEIPRRRLQAWSKNRANHPHQELCATCLNLAPPGGAARTDGARTGLARRQPSRQVVDIRGIEQQRTECSDVDITPHNKR